MELLGRSPMKTQVIIKLVLVVLLVVAMLRGAESRRAKGQIFESFEYTAMNCRAHSASLTDFGGVGDGKTSNTKAFHAAVSQLSQYETQGGAQLFVPAGKWLTGSFNLTSHFTLYLHKDAVLLASQDINEWPVLKALPSYGRGRDAAAGRYTSLIWGTNLTDVVVTGDNGTIDGQGEFWWQQFHKKKLKYTRPYLIEIMFSTDVQIFKPSLSLSLLTVAHSLSLPSLWPNLELLAATFFSFQSPSRAVSSKKMAATTSFPYSSAIFLSILIISGFMSPETVNSMGINYGQITNNLPSPDDVVPLVKAIGISKIKLYDADPKVLKAFANTGVQFIVGLPNEYLAKVQDPAQAQSWVKSNVQAHLPATNITYIFVGNEVLTFNDTSLSNNLLPALQSVHTALVGLGLDKQVAVTTAHSLSILQTSYPPSAGAFRRDLTGCITPILNFHAKTGSPFLINAYPYFAYKSNPKQVPLEYVLFQPNSGSLDPATNLHYDNMLFAQIDAVYSALGSLGFKKLPVHISETGWPSKGDEDEVGATPENAKKYNGNLIKLICQKKGTPLRPGSDLNIYVFALFNENMKPGPSSERNFGLFKPDGSPAYSIGLSTGNISFGNSNSSSSSGSGSGSGQGQVNPISNGGSPSGSSGTPYLSISSAPATERFHVIGWIAMMWLLASLLMKS